MYMTEKGTAYSDGFFEVVDGRVINPLTGRSLGIVVRTIESNNYICKKEDTVWTRIKRWFENQNKLHSEALDRHMESEMMLHNPVPDKAEGDLATTMRNLPERKPDKLT